ncbi:HAAS signaling domain-containing protein [Tahibacter caeni]|uniref:HAAS signaling domain-containing protein n=1 Tax=Tahibacter caeni TaxID=1453545 RepID=UPI0021475A30|nr:hypothetical protein [Tahibacter caeni]
MSNETREFEPWLRRLKWALSALPAQDRDDIVAETRAHLRDACDAGQTPAQVLAGFGGAEDYARQFVDQMELSGALGAGRSGPMLRLVLRRAHRSLIATVATTLVLVCVLLAVTGASLVFFELSDPVHTGFWSGGGNLFVGVIDDPAKAVDLLGTWLLPAALAAVVLPLLLGRLVLLWTVRRLAGRK